jgi:N-acetylneuraminic acid mutarotase
MLKVVSSTILSQRPKTTWMRGRGVHSILPACGMSFLKASSMIVVISGELSMRTGVGLVRMLRGRVGRWKCDEQLVLDTADLRAYEEDNEVLLKLL